MKIKPVSQVQDGRSVVGQELAADLVQDFGRGRHRSNHLQERGQLEPCLFEGHVGQGLSQTRDTGFIFVLTFPV